MWWTNDYNSIIKASKKWIWGVGGSSYTRDRQPYARGHPDSREIALESPNFYVINSEKGNSVMSYGLQFIICGRELEMCKIAYVIY